MALSTGMVLSLVNRPVKNNHMMSAAKQLHSDKTRQEENCYLSQHLMRRVLIQEKILSVI